jgi:adenylosuccinate synthase
MRQGKFNFIIDQAHGSSGKGKLSPWLVDHFDFKNVSSSNFPNAGHTLEYTNLPGQKFMAKVLPTSAALKKFQNRDVVCWLSPGSGFDPERLILEWNESGKPQTFIHERASIVTKEHKLREQSGADSTKHIASTMQGSAAALIDKILRKADCILAKNVDWGKYVNQDDLPEFTEKVKTITGQEFRNKTYDELNKNNGFCHEVSQGYALSIDHGSHYPMCTSRNCTLQAGMDQMAVPPSKVGDVYLNIRSIPIRVGNVIENGEQKGYSGDFYPDSIELTWEQVAKNAGMSIEETENLKKRELTTVTLRQRRCATFSYIGLKDAVRVNGATKLCVNFIQYINWNDRGLKGGIEAFEKLSKESRDFISKIEETVNIPVVLIGTGALHDEVISLYNL